MVLFFINDLHFKNDFIDGYSFIPFLREKNLQEKKFYFISLIILTMNISSMETFEDPQFALHRAKFIIFITLQIPAILLTLFIFTFFLTHRTVLKNLQNQSLLVLLIANFMQLTIDISMHVHFYYFGYIIPATAGYCTWWTFCGYTLLLIGAYLMVTISIQRHTLIFQPQIFHVRFKRYILYYLPLLLSIIYPILFYMIAIFFYPCDGTQWDFTASVCGYANCYLVYNKVLSTFDWAGNTGLSIIVICVANMTLIVRVIKQKLRRQQLVTWKKQRRMALQMLGISSLYITSWLPALIVAVIQQLISPSFLAQIQADYIIDLIYLPCLLLPWACLSLLPELTKWLWKFLRCGILAGNVIRPA
jgi:hypothetical protein